MKSYLEALKIINDEVSTISLPNEIVRIGETLNRILAEDIIADVDLPPFDNSAMDGYAVKISERKQWKLVGEITAGKFHNISLSDDETVLITTGSKIPENADTIIPVEDVLVSNDKIELKINTSLRKGMNVRSKGNDLTKGKTAVPVYTKINPNVISVLASCGKELLRVFTQLKIATLCTGDELIPIDQIPFDDKLRISNSYSLNFAIKEMNHISVDYGFVEDDYDLIKEKIQQMLLDDNDVIITTGGVSVGKYDFIKEIYTELGIERKFWQVNIKPGKPIIFGVYMSDGKKKLVFGLPGNPVSSLVTFYIFVKPAVDLLFKQADDDFIYAELDNDITKIDNKRHFSRGIMFINDNKLKVKTLLSQSSGNLVEMSRSNCLIEIPEEVANLKINDIVKCIKI